MQPTLRLLPLGLLAACNLSRTDVAAPAFTPPPIVWERVADAPLARFEGQSVVVGGELYVFGGYTDGSVIPKSFEVNVYNPADDTWNTLPELPRPLTHAGTATDGVSIYLAGGVVGSENPQDTAKIPATTEVWRFNTVTEVWSAMPPLPEPRGAGALVVFGDALHYFGGTGEDRYGQVGEHWALPLAGGSAWRALAPLPNPRNHIAGVVVGNAIYAVGGQHGHNETLVTQDSVERYDPATDTWTPRASLPYGLGHVGNSTLVVDGLVYVVGGETGGYGLYTANVLVYDPELDAWSTTTPYPRAENSLIGGAVGDKIFITGGSGRDLQTIKGTLVAP